MGTLNLASLISRVRTFFANRTDLTDEDIVTYLNLSQEAIAKENDWEELEGVKSGTLGFTSSALNDKFLTIETTIKEIHSFRIITSDGRSRKLTFRSLRSFDKDIPEPEYFARGVPEEYTLHDGKAELWRVPDAAYDYLIRTTNWPTVFDASSPNAVSDLDRKDLALIYRAASIGYDGFGEYEKAKRFFGVYRALIDIDVSEDDSKPDRDIKPRLEFDRASGVGLGDGQYWLNPWVRQVR